VTDSDSRAERRAAARKAQIEARAKEIVAEWRAPTQEQREALARLLAFARRKTDDG